MVETCMWKRVIAFECLECGGLVRDMDAAYTHVCKAAVVALKKHEEEIRKSYEEALLTVENITKEDLEEAYQQALSEIQKAEEGNIK